VTLRSKQERMLYISFVASAVAHGAFVVVWAWFTFSQQKPPFDLDQAIVKTHLVKLGKPRDEKLLPRLPTQAPPPQVDKQAPPTPEKPVPSKPEEAADKKPSAADVLSKFESENTRPDVQDLINKRLGEPTDEGQEDGDRLGKELTGTLKASYVQRLIAQIAAHQQISETISDEERVRLKAVLNVQIDDEGNVVKAWVNPSSGNDVYDNDVLAAVNRAAPLPAPPVQLRELFSSGVAFNMCPVSCR
jgi:colicin import membrane protein